MQIKITAPLELRQKIVLPSSKSISNRALLIHALSDGHEAIENVSDCDDTFVMQRALTQDCDTVDIMAAGTAMRFLTAYYAATHGEKTITGTARMKQRPIRILVDALRALGADISYVENEGFPPLHIIGGRMNGGAVSIPGSVSSQYISALLMIGPVLDGGLCLELTGDIISRPYIDMTLSLMRSFGAEAAWQDERRITVSSVPYADRPYYVESDWSAASYWYEMLVLSQDADAEFVLPGLFEESLQGDAAVRHIFAMLGVETSFFTGEDGLPCARICKKKGFSLPGRIEYDFVNQPDLAQTVVVACAMLGVPFRFTGLQSLKIKETDRMAALICELGKLGYKLEERDGATLVWDGGRMPVNSDTVAIDTYEDHRMAMAFAPCALRLPYVRVNDPGVVSKSYPGYWAHLEQAGFKIVGL